MPSIGVGAALVLDRTTKYPEGAVEAAVKPPDIVLPLVGVIIKFVGCAVGVEHGVGATALPVKGLVVL